MTVDAGRRGEQTKDEGLPNGLGKSTVGVHSSEEFIAIPEVRTLGQSNQSEGLINI